VHCSVGAYDFFMTRGQNLTLNIQSSELLQSLVTRTKEAAGMPAAP